MQGTCVTSMAFFALVLKCGACSDHFSAFGVTLVCIKWTLIYIQPKIKISELYPITEP